MAYMLLPFDFPIFKRFLCDKRYQNSDFFKETFLKMYQKILTRIILKSDSDACRVQTEVLLCSYSKVHPSFRLKQIFSTSKSLSSATLTSFTSMIVVKLRTTRGQLKNFPSVYYCQAEVSVSKEERRRPRDEPEANSRGPGKWSKRAEQSYRLALLYCRKQLL